MAKKPHPQSFRFLAPNKLFAISLNTGWHPVAPGKDKAVTQFSVGKKGGVTISCRPVRDEHKQLITANHLEPQDSRIASLAFVELNLDNDEMSMYTWLCLVDEFLVSVTYTFHPSEKKNVPFVRSSLATFRFYNPDIPTIADEQSPCIDFSDIKCWTAKPTKYLEFLSNDKKRRKAYKKIEFPEIDIIKLYSLLKIAVSPEPNGIHTLMLSGFPIDQMIWWDFVFESEKGFVHIWRTANIVEAIYTVEDKDFDLKEFLEANIKRYIKEIQQVQKRYTKFTTYINQYRSYSDVVDHLWKQVKLINIKIPKSPLHHRRTEKEMSEFSANMKLFIDSSIQYHALGKSLVLNAAFKIESFVNLVIRVGATRELRNYPDVLDKFTKSPFPDRLKNLKFYSQIIASNIDMNNKAVKDALELMTMRNKYVHFDESSSHNRLDDLYFDGDFPLQEISKHRPVFEAFRQMFHIPDLKTIEKAHKTSTAFVQYLHTLFIPQYKGYLDKLFMQNPISYNTVKNTYSITSGDLVMEFAVAGKSARTKKKKK